MTAPRMSKERQQEIRKLAEEGLWHERPVYELLAELTALREENEKLRAQRDGLEFSREFYSCRMERLKDFLKKHNLWNNESASIYANGTETAWENPSYAQAMNSLTHERNKARKDRDEARTLAQRLVGALNHITEKESLGSAGNAWVVARKAVANLPAWAKERGE